MASQSKNFAVPKKFGSQKSTFKINTTASKNVSQNTSQRLFDSEAFKH